MKLKSIEDVNKFLEAVNKCEGGVFLMAPDGSRYNLNSQLSQYVAIGQLLGDHGQELELWCENRKDEWVMINFLWENPEIAH